MSRLISQDGTFRVGMPLSPHHSHNDIMSNVMMIALIGVVALFAAVAVGLPLYVLNHVATLEAIIHGLSISIK